MALQAADRRAVAQFPTSGREERFDDTLLVYSGIDGALLAQKVMILLTHQPPTYAGGVGVKQHADQSNTVVSWWSSTPSFAFDRIQHAPSKPTSAASDQAWFKVAHATRGPLSLEQVGRIFDGLNELLHDYRFRMIDEAFESSRLPQMSVDAIVVFARTTYPARNRISRWRDFVDRAQRELADRGEDGVLSGL